MKKLFFGKVWKLVLNKLISVIGNKLIVVVGLAIYGALFEGYPGTYIQARLGSLGTVSFGVQDKSIEPVGWDRQFNIKLHVIENENLNNDKASICRSNKSKFYKKTITIFDNRPESKIPGIVRVGGWDFTDDALCAETDNNHIWVNLETANQLFRGSSTSVPVGGELDMLGRVPKLFIDSIEVS